MFTEPDDQTAWFYHRWCVTAGQAHADATPADAPAWREHLQAQCVALQELRTVEPDSKCACRAPAAPPRLRTPPRPPPGPLHALAFLQRILGEGEPAAAFEALGAMDPWHAAFYKHAATASGAFFGLGAPA